ncbi:hypothetical protein F7725_012429 [Dissostichus mawsoni]|uniref:NACHT domain-containing protein n=1 Tax=Dissostichus mawsoni TaxID=36200 RepID=A0A7J5YQI3_DISMA|nr:hypothetical protein F7725_012429 [Dissostichus mawsoni]
MLKLWTEKDDKELDYMFYFDMRKISNIKSLEDLLFNEFSEPDEGKDEVLQDIKNNSDNVTLMFDGITDLSSPVVQKLVNKDWLQDSKVVLTCRPADEDHLLSEDFLRVEKSPSLMEYLIPAEELKNTSNWFFKEVISTFLPLCENDESDTEDSGRILFLCQCLYESQCPEACIDLLEKLDFHLDLSEESLDPYPCCAVAYVITQSKERKIWLNLEDVTMCDSLPRQLWEIFLLSEGEMDYITLLGLDGNRCTFQWRGKENCSKEQRTHRGPGLQDLERCYETLKREEKQLFLDLCLRAANHIQGESSQNEVNNLISLFSFNTDVHNILLDFYQHVKTQEGSAVIQKLKSVLQSSPAVWTIDLSQRETSILLEVLRLQPEKKQVRLRGCSDEESEVRTLLQCLPYISLISYQNLQVNSSSLGLCSVQQQREEQTGEKTLQLLLSSAAAVWTIDLSERKTSILLEVLTLQPEKKQVELRGCSDEESEVRTFLQCLPYISQISFSQRFGLSEEVKFFGTLLCAAAEREQQTGEKTLELLSSVCTYPTFPFTHIDDEDDEGYQCGFLLDLASHLKDCETETVSSAVWTIDLSERKTSILLEVLRLQPEKKQVELRGCSDEESEVRTFLQCLPYISQLSLYNETNKRLQGVESNIIQCKEALDAFVRKLEYRVGKMERGELQQFPLLLKQSRNNPETVPVSVRREFIRHMNALQKEMKSRFADIDEYVSKELWVLDPFIAKVEDVEYLDCEDELTDIQADSLCGPEFFQRVCTFISVRSREEAERLASVLQLSGFTLLLSGELPRKTCLSVGRVLQLCGSNVDLILKPRKMSFKGAFALFRRTTQLHSLKLSKDMALLLCGWVRRWGVVCQVTVEELSLSPQTAQPSHRVLLKVVSSLASLLRYWAVRQLDLTEVCVPALGLTPLLLHDGPLKIKLSEKNVQQLLSLLHELQDQDLTWSFLSKLGGDLTSFSLNWELLRLLLQHPSAQTLTVNMRKNLFLQENITRLLPYLDRIVFKRPCPSFVLTAIREIYKARASPIIPSLLRSLDHVINLTCREMSPVDCDALLYTLAHSDGVRLNLLWTSIPAWKIESILLNLDNEPAAEVVHGCAASGAQQGAAESLLRTVQHRLDLSCSSCVELPEEDQSDPLRLTAEDCRAVSTILRRSRRPGHTAHPAGL